MTQSNYLSSPAKIAKRRNPLLGFFGLILVGLVTFLGIGTTNGVKEASASGPIDPIICTFFGPDHEFYKMYELTFTDEGSYLMLSKSVVISGNDDVTSGLNSLIALTHDFKGVNEKILGRSLDPSVEYDGEYNGGAKVNPYDRFGFAGLNWSSYSGEWNYQKVDICSNAPPLNMRIGMFYPDRLYPRSTFSDVENSSDVRSELAASKGSVVLLNWPNVVANGVFMITKTVVALTNTLINLSFVDLTKLIGLDKLLTDPTGIFGKLYQGLYIPLIGLVMLITAVWAAWNGIVKRAYRRTLGGILQSFLMFILAGVIAFSPAFWISLPNNVVIIMQSLIVNTMSTSLYAGDGLCSVGGTFTVDEDGKSIPAEPDSEGNVKIGGEAPDDPTNVEEAGDLLSQASQSMQSVIGCQLWYSFAFRPWVLGQYGTDFNNLWAEGYADTAIHAESTALKNDNTTMVGTADVPLGGGYLLHNWALFQLSTQTNVHAELAEPSEAATYTDGVANDWWRIVDAVANYNEVEETNGIPLTNNCNSEVVEGSGCAGDGSSSNLENVDTTATKPDISKLPTEYWETWTGKKPFDRLGVALSSVVPAVVGNLAPMVFAGMSALFGLAISLAMALAPIFLLLGCWPGKGFNIFKEWGKLVLDLVVKRIIAGLLLVVSLIFISMLLEMIGAEGNYFFGTIMLCLISFALVVLRKRIFDLIGGLFSFNFASGAFSDTSMDTFSKLGKKVKDGVGTVGSATIAGAIAGSEGTKTDPKGATAGSFIRGFGRGAMNDLKTKMYSGGEIGRQTAMAIDKMMNADDAMIRPGIDICAYCGNPILEAGFSREQALAARDNDGNWVCEDCASGRGVKGSLPIQNGGDRLEMFKVMTEEVVAAKKTMGLNSGNPSDDELADEIERSRHQAKLLDPSFVMADKSTIDDALKKVKFVDGNTGKIHPDLRSLLAESFTEQMKTFEATGEVPPIPDTLKQYVPAINQEKIEVLWRDGGAQAKETLAYAYAEAFVEFSYDNGVDLGEFAEDTEATVMDDVRAVYGDIITASTKPSR